MDESASHRNLTVPIGSAMGVPSPDLLVSIRPAESARTESAVVGNLDHSQSSGAVVICIFDSLRCQRAARSHHSLQPSKAFGTIGAGLPGMTGGPSLASPLETQDPSSRSMRPSVHAPLFCDPSVNIPC